MSVAVAQFHPAASPLTAIANALDVAEKVYGIKGAADKAELVRQQIEQNKASMALAQQNADPNSQVSQIKQADQSAYVGAAQKKGYIGQDQASNLLGLIKGQPGTPGSPEISNEQGPGRPEIAAIAGKPGLSGAQLDSALKEGGQLAGFVKGEQAASAKQAGFNFRDSQMQDRQDYMAHQKTLARLKGDPQLAKRLGQYQNLQNALGNFQNADITNPQALDELQQGIRQNLGIGGGGVGEREHTYINSLGLNADRIKQFITGDPVAISKDSNLARHLQQLVGLESQNISNQMSKRISALTAGNASVYARNPEYASDLQGAIKAAGDQFATSPAPESAAQTQAPPAESGGGSVLGNLFGSQASASGGAAHITKDAIDAEKAKRAASRKAPVAGSK